MQVSSGIMLRRRPRDAYERIVPMIPNAHFIAIIIIEGILQSFANEEKTNKSPKPVINLI